MKLKTAIEYWEFKWDDMNLDSRDFIDLYKDYIIFLKQPLQLGFFIPCDKDGKPLSEPYLIEGNEQYYGAEMDEYQQARDRVLFKGFEIVEHSKGYFYIENDIHVVAQKNYGCEWVFVGYDTVEDLSGKVGLVEKVAEQFKY